MFALMLDVACYVGAALAVYCALAALVLVLLPVPTEHVVTTHFVTKSPSDRVLSDEELEAIGIDELMELDAAQEAWEQEYERRTSY